MASDFRSLQHDAAMATHSLIGAVERLCEMQTRHPNIIFAEYNDIAKAYMELRQLLVIMGKQAA